MWIAAAIVIIVVVTLLAFQSQKAANRESATRCDDCNVLLIGVDTLRADHMHAFGYERDATPNIDALAARGISFTNAISASSWTVPSFMSIMTGVYPSVHKVTNKFVEFNAKSQVTSNLQKLSPSLETLAQQFKKAGFATGGFTGDAGIGAQFGHKAGYDVYTDEKTFGEFKNSNTHAIDWLNALPKGQKFYMFLQGYDLHGQFNLPKDDQIFLTEEEKKSDAGLPKNESVLREAQLAGPLKYTESDVKYWNDLYDSKMHYADADIGVMLNELDKRGLLKNTIVVLVADHGEEFFEHGGIDHGQSLYGELIHVPIVVAMPGNTKASQVSAQVSMLDVAPTILELAGVKPSEQFAKQQQGMSLVPYMTGAKTQGSDVFMETDYRDFTHIRSVRTVDGWEYIKTLQTGREELYNLNDDPAEKHNIIENNPEKAATLKAKLEKHMREDLKVDPNKKYLPGCLPVYKGECE